ncbi:MFS transporter [Paucibacter sp. APW11]|uniref:MFS transporter n=1 Tax=Roseateles aquae TaxID=3077235 RepID=A0ABU3PEG2_9BURK|nr:MFS transporter [Paucibacter sp. APW11]MDT9000908.1 MFS transporter [Paucibacter sp. APW11]
MTKPWAFLASIFATDFAGGGARVAICWIVLKGYGGAGLGLVTLLITVGQFFGSLAAGHLTDRFNRKRIAVFTNWLGAGLFLLTAIGLSQGAQPLSNLAILAFLIYTNLAIHDNAARTLIPRIESSLELREINGYILTLGEIGYFIAPVLIGLTLDKFGAEIALSITAGAYFIAGSLFSLTRFRTTNQDNPTTDCEQTQGLSTKFFKKNYWLINGIYAAAIANFFILPISTLLIPIKLERLGASAADLGYFYAALSLGLGLAGLSKIPKITGFSEGALLHFYITLAAAIYLLTYFFSTTWVVYLCGFFAGFTLALFEITWHSTLQELTPPNLLGRIYGVNSWMSFGGRSAGMAVASWAATSFEVQPTIAASIACLFMLVAAQRITARRLHRLG